MKTLLITLNWTIQCLIKLLLSIYEALHSTVKKVSFESLLSIICLVELSTSYDLIIITSQRKVKDYGPKRIVPFISLLSILLLVGTKAGNSFPGWLPIHSMVITDNSWC